MNIYVMPYFTDRDFYVVCNMKGSFCYFRMYLFCLYKNNDDEL